MRPDATLPLARPAVALALLALAACAHKARPPAPAPLPVERPLVALERAKVESVGFTGLSLSVGCRLENPNPFPLSVQRITYRFALEGRAAAAGSVEAPLAVQASRPLPEAAPGGAAPGLASVTLPVAIRYHDVPAFAPLLNLDREAAWTLTGEVTFLTPAGSISVPMAQEGRIALPRAPRIKVHRAALGEASPRTVTVELAVKVENPNPFDLPAGRLGLGLLLSDREVARIDLIAAEPVPPGGEAMLSAPVRISVLKAGTAAARLLLPFTSLDVRLKGEAVFDGVPVPLDLSSSLLPR